MFKLKQLLPGLLSMALLSPLAVMADTASGGTQPITTDAKLNLDMLGLEVKSFLDRLPPCSEDHGLRKGDLKSDPHGSEGLFNLIDDNASFTMPAIGTLTHLQYVFRAEKGDAAYTLFAYSGLIEEPLLPYLDFKASEAVCRRHLEETYGPCEVVNQHMHFNRDAKFNLVVEMKQTTAKTIGIRVEVFDKD